MKSPRFWLILWGSIGVICSAYVLISASLKPNQAPTQVYLRGEMAGFTLTFPPRKAGNIPFSFEGDEITLQNFRGKIVLVNFWATWCAPCLKELPSLNALQKRYDSDKFEIVAIAADPRGPEVAGEFLKKLNIDALPLYADPRLLFTSSIGGANILPVSIIYDKKGTEIGRFIGEADWNSPESNALIQALIRGETIKK